MRQLQNHELARVQRPLFTGPRVYHYATIETFKRIVESDEFWLSDYSYLNDSSEVKHGIETAKSELASLSTALATPEHAMLTRALNIAPDHQPRICLACFSQDGDSLSQWRAYGSKNVAVAIGIEPSEFFSAIGHPMETRPAPVVYEPLSKLSLVRGLLHDWAELYRLDRGQCEPEQLDVYEQLPQGTFFELFSMLKHESFRNEREFRFIYLEDPHLFDRGVFEKAPKRFRMAGPILVPYTTTRDLAPLSGGVSKHGRLKLAEIIVGPHPYADLAEAGIREFLGASGHADVAVSRSQVPFR